MDYQPLTHKNLSESLRFVGIDRDAGTYRAPTLIPVNVHLEDNGVRVVAEISRIIADSTEVNQYNGDVF